MFAVAEILRHALRPRNQIAMGQNNTLGFAGAAGREKDKRRRVGVRRRQGRGRRGRRCRRLGLHQLFEPPHRLSRSVASAQQQILALARVRAEHNAGRPLVNELDYRVLLPPMGGMSGGEIRDILRRALEEKVHTAGQGQEPGPVTTQDLLRQVDVYRRIRAVVEKIRYGQYL